MKYEFLVESYASERLKVLSVWSEFQNDIDISAPPLPQQETRIEFIKRYAEDCGKRLATLQRTDDRLSAGRSPGLDEPANAQRKRATCSFHNVLQISHRNDCRTRSIRCTPPDWKSFPFHAVPPGF